MATPLTLNTELGGDGKTRVVAAGEIDLSNIHMFKQALFDASGDAGAPITIDLGAVKYLDSAGINALFDHAEAVEHLHVVVHPLLVRVLTVSGFCKIATIEAAS
ncbi:anti-anti-sigma factor [Mycobacterium asiaticum]|uniref:Anti-anti-sigma factor n=1 Tax=Mycobacterium asiaticum TaxID=1790 RepID=A0A1A3NPG1_MYCAS|nr:STAS domain-containing protein [Mycobacterium asiaticum]OBK23245.1 anti-anti-sigma factor [Mycobacterium asiaticum]